jgi:hypothetical protein
MYRKVLSPVFNDGKDSADRTASGRQFQIRGAAHENRLAAKLALCGGTCARAQQACESVWRQHYLLLLLKQFF